MSSPTLDDAEVLLRDLRRIADEKVVELRTINRYAALDFSPFRFIDSGEVQTTHLLASFLDPNGSHGQGDVFQLSFLKKLRSESTCDLPSGPYRVEAERRHDGVRQIDLLLRAPNNAGGICIENKLFARDQDKQLTDYHTYLRSAFPSKAYLIVYLTRERRTPDPGSISKKELSELKATGQYTNITYDSFIPQLLDDWITLAFPEKVKTFLKDWKSNLNRHLFSISDTPTIKMTNEELAEYLLKNTTHYRTAQLVQPALNEANKQLRQRLVSELSTLAASLGLHTKLYDERELAGFENWNAGKPFLMRSDRWGAFAIAFEFDGQDFYYGVRFERRLPDDPERRTYNYAPAITGELQEFSSEQPTKDWPVVNMFEKTWESLRSRLIDKTFITDIKPDVQRLKLKLDALAAADKLTYKPE